MKEQADAGIDLGDLYDREMACPSTNNAQCGGSPAPLRDVPFTDSGWGWVADVLVLRGNHELCSRGGNGTFLLFDPAADSGDRCAPKASGQAPIFYSPTRAVELVIQGGCR